MEEITRHLSEVIGPRPAGSEADHQAAKYLLGTMKNMGLDVQLQPFKFMGWEPTGPTNVEILAPFNKTLSSGCFMFSDSTPKGGITGKLTFVGTMYLCPGMFEWPKYVVKNEKDEACGYIIANTGGRAINFVLHELGRQFGRAPYIMVDKDAHDLFQKELNAGREVQVCIETSGRILADMTTANVIGRIQGSSLPDEEIVLCAHYDASPQSHGADDNASGVEAMLQVAERIQARGRPKKTVTFIAFAAEEYLCYGSKYFVQTLKENGLLGRIKNVLNLDMVGHGEYLWVHVAPESYRRQIESAFQKDISDLIGWDWTSAIMPISDHHPFFVEGIPSAMFICWPYEDYHQPSDTFDKIDPDLIRKSAIAADSVIRRLAGV